MVQELVGVCNEQNNADGNQQPEIQCLECKGQNEHQVGKKDSAQKDKLMLCFLVRHS